MVAVRTVTSFEDRVGRVLLEGGFINEQQLRQAREDSSTGGVGLLDLMVSKGVIAQETLVTVLSFQLRIPVVDLRQVQVDLKAVQLLPEDIARQNKVMPIAFDTDGSLRIATSMPNDFRLSAELTSVTGRQTKFVLAIGGRLEDLIDRIYSAAPVQQRRPEAGIGAAPAGPLAPATVSTARDLAGVDLAALPAVQAVDMVTLQAVKGRASDIHMVPASDSGRVLFRIDGVLRQMIVLPLTLHESMVSRIKVMAGMDIAENRRPQDGNFSLMFGEKKAEFRVSSVGTNWGELMVIRVLDESGGLFNLGAVGLDPGTLQLWRGLLALPYGMVMVSGPTGSGKTTTLYASVGELVNNRGNIMSVEDPIEYRVDGVNQIQVNRAAGIDFPTGLRSIMRLDPDVILVGEIRDEETAKTAVNAALTGHLVLASIHSNDTAAAVVRLIDLGVEPFLVATAVLGCLAQRLVRKVDQNCKMLSEPTAMEALAYEQEMQEAAGQFYVGQGCNFCGGTGFSGRTGVFEVLTINESIRKLIASRASGQQIRSEALTNGLVTLRRSGTLKAQAGITTLGEVLKSVFFLD